MTEEILQHDFDGEGEFGYLGVAALFQGVQPEDLIAGGAGAKRGSGSEAVLLCHGGLYFIVFVPQAFLPMFLFCRTLSVA